MDKDELKVYLKDNPQYIKETLEYIGCTYVSIKRKRISARRPNGRNKGSISVLLNDSLSTSIFTKPEFKAKYPIRDFYSLLEYLANYNLYESIKLIHDICGLSFDGNFTPKEKSTSYAFIKQFKRSISKNDYILPKEEILDEKIKDQFFKEPSDLFLKDNISKSTQEKFEVYFDVIENRIVFPIRNYEGDLLTFKGRTCDNLYREKGISKYLYYYPFKGEYYLYGYYENLEYIQQADFICVFEAEKSVQQCDSFEVNNCLAVSKKDISNYQVSRLLKLGKDIVICFDKDVTLDEIKIQCRKFRGLCKVFYIWDEDNLLSHKDSPSDKGKDIFLELLNNKILFKE